MCRTLDTHICSYVLRRRPASRFQRFPGSDRGRLWLSAIVAAELRFGAAKLESVRFSVTVKAWLAGFDVRQWPAEATGNYAKIRASLERVGGMDLLIAAHAMAEDSVLVTNNTREFLRVPGLAVEEWGLNA